MRMNGFRVVGLAVLMIGAVILSVVPASMKAQVASIYEGSSVVDQVTALPDIGSLSSVADYSLSSVAGQVAALPDFGSLSSVAGYSLGLVFPARSVVVNVVASNFRLTGSTVHRSVLPCVIASDRCSGRRLLGSMPRYGLVRSVVLHRERRSRSASDFSAASPDGSGPSRA